MDYNTLVAPKTTVGSIANFVNYSKVETNLPTILAEAQALLYQLLRVREMQTTLHFKMTVGLSSYALPTRFLDPIGSIISRSENLELKHKLESTVKAQRSFSETEGTLGTDPLTTVVDTSLVTVAKTAHGFTQDSLFAMAGGSAVGGLTLNGAYEIVSIAANTFVIDAIDVATSSATGGGAAITYTCDTLEQGTPQIWGLWDNRIKFDQAFDDTRLLQLPYYQSLALLSSTNTTNFLTSRYPHLLRTACVAAASDFMKDDAEYQKAMTRLGTLVGSTQAEGDLMYRGADLETWNPPT